MKDELLSEDQKQQLADLGDKLEREFYLNNPRKGVIDTIQEKMVSRKLLVFMVATVLLYMDQLDPDTWGMLAMMYVGGQSAIDFAKVWRGSA